MDEIYTTTSTATDCGGSDLIKARIATHPLYPTMLSAYIECQKIGAPPEMASLLQEMLPHTSPATSTSTSTSSSISTTCTKIGDDPELDHFMETYCNILVGYKQELSKPFQEASTFLTNIQTQLNQICTGISTTTISDDATGSSDEELSCGIIESSDGQESLGPHPGEQELKDMLMRKYSGYLISLKKDFLNKKKKGKLPKNARTTLLDWWNTHYRWPYPTEEDKIQLAEMTGLDQKQINNWFINQRKRHWRPSEDMRCALIEGVSGSEGSVFYDNIG